MIFGWSGGLAVPESFFRLYPGLTSWAIVCRRSATWASGLWGDAGAGGGSWGGVRGRGFFLRRLFCGFGAFALLVAAVVELLVRGLFLHMLIISYLARAGASFVCLGREPSPIFRVDQGSLFLHEGSTVAASAGRNENQGSLVPSFAKAAKLGQPALPRPACALRPGATIRVVRLRWDPAARHETLGSCR
jgi:hypothetical protein